MKIEAASPTIRRKEMDAVLTAMVEEKIGPGERNKLLIQSAKEHIKFDYALALRSPAVALHLALKAVKDQYLNKLNETGSLNKTPGVLISALSPVFYLNVLEDLQLVPVFCDVSSDFPCISRETIDSALARKNDSIQAIAIVVHHTLGFMPDTASIAETGIPVIEDVSQSCFFRMSNEELGISNKKEGETGSNAQVNNIFNGMFYILGLEERDMLTAGGGAILFAMNRKDGNVLRNYSNLASEYCLPDINAALAIVQFKELHKNIERRKEIAGVYRQSSLRTRHKRFIVNNTEDDINYYSFSLILETGLKDVIAYAKKKDIILENAFEKTIASFKTCENCSVSGSLVLRTVLFPMYPRLTSKDVDSVSRLIMTLP